MITNLYTTLKELYSKFQRILGVINRLKNILEVEEKIKEHDEQLKKRNELIFSKGVFWSKDGADPFCPKCLQNSPFKFAYLRENNVREKESWVCTACDKTHISPEGQKRLLDAYNGHVF